MYRMTAFAAVILFLTDYGDGKEDCFLVSHAMAGKNYLSYTF